ncbi:MAG TPA: histidine phosphatase family protein [Candidatus Nitrosotalea sp.]|nr:histidine phosphatase family protein [Candidatus Nitrosotalea sp.]
MYLFLRHGQARNNVERILAGRAKGYPLTDMGVKQAQNIAEFLKPFSISAVYSSPVERAEQTAGIVARALGLEYAIDQRLTEIDMGALGGMAYQEMFEKHGNIFLRFYEGHPIIEQNGMETFASIKNRVLDLVEHASKKHPEGDVLFVTHMDPIKSLLSTVLQLRPESLYELIIRNASLTMFKKEQGSLSVVSVNSMCPERYLQD